MREATYSLEFAKTGRSKCKSCKTPLVKDDIRLCVVVPKSGEGGFEMTSYHHVGCFKLPRKYSQGAGKITPLEFLQEYVTDTTADNSILPAKLEELAEKMEDASSNKTKAKAAAADEDETGGEMTLIARVKAAYKRQEGEKEPPKKKKKNDAELEPLVESYANHCKSKVEDLKEMLRWNRQMLTGVKDVLLFKIMDGEQQGRLGLCGLCGGRLKFSDDMEHVICSGRFDEDLNIRQPCGFQADRMDSKLPREPWLKEEPTEEEKAAMDEQAEQARGEGGAEDSDLKTSLLEAAESLDWKLINKAGIQKATAELTELVMGKLDLPEDPKKAKMALGSLIVGNKEKTPKEIVEIVLTKYGVAEEKEKKAAAKEAALESMCECPNNAPILMAFQELAQLYFKEGNRNAGASYTKAVGAVKGLDFEITEDNAMSLSKGKTKVANIGKASAEKMKEFLETGTMAKLEEKRAANA